ncbi:MAG: MFS transporter [Bacillota bacterium]
MGDRRQANLFFTACVLLNLAANFAHAVTPTIIKDRGFGDYMFGVALASMMTVNFLVSPFWGKLITFVSSRKVILICSLGYAMGQAFFWLAGSERAMVGARMFAGVFIAGVFTACLTYVVNTTPTELRGRYLTVMATVQMVASSFGYFVGGMLGEFGVSATMMAQVVVLAASGVLFFIICRDDRDTTQKEIALGPLFRQANPVAAFIAGKHIMTPLLIAVFLVTALTNLGSTAFDGSFNYYLKAQLDLSSGYNGAIKGVIGLVSLAANGTLGMWLVVKSDIRRSWVLVNLLCACSMLAVLLLNATVPFVLANILYFALFAVSAPLTQNLLARTAEGKDTNLTMGYYNGVKSLGGIAGSLSSGVLYMLNPKWPFLLGFLAYLIATGASVYYYRRSKREDVAGLSVGST